MTTLPFSQPLYNLKSGKLKSGGLNLTKKKNKVNQDCLLYVANIFRLAPVKKRKLSHK